jgi:hypothetical protein
MAVQLSTSVRNARINAIETTISTAAKIQLRSGAQPANCATADSGTLIAEFTAASDWLAAAASGTASLNGVPLSIAASNAGTLGHFRIKDNGGTTCHVQGSITATGGGGDMTVDNTSVTAGQTVQITALSFTDANA